MDLQTLRRETQADHAAVEGSVPLMHEGLTQHQYVDCLRRIYGVVAAWEEAAVSFAPPSLQPMLAARQRKPLLHSDLAWFGIAPDESRATMPSMNHLPTLFGTMYVMEGSTLGGQFIARHVETALALSPGHGNTYFRGHGAQTGPMWKEFCAVLQSSLPDDQTPTVIIAAKAMFATFGDWMRREVVHGVS